MFPEALRKSVFYVDFQRRKRRNDGVAEIYRPIPLTSVFAELYYKIMLARPTEYIEAIGFNIRFGFQNEKLSIDVSFL